MRLLHRLFTEIFHVKQTSRPPPPTTVAAMVRTALLLITWEQVDVLKICILYVFPACSVDNVKQQIDR